MARARRSVKEIEIASLLPASVARDRKTAYDRVRPVLAFYVGYFPRYQRVARGPTNALANPVNKPSHEHQTDTTRERKQRFGQGRDPVAEQDE